jgi:hypothetical protein
MRPRPRRISTGLIAVISAVVLVAASGLTVAATGAKLYTAAWVSGSGTVSTKTIPGGTSSVVLRLRNESSSNSVRIRSANIVVPAAYTLNSGSIPTGTGDEPIVDGNTLKLRGLSVARNTSIDITISITTNCGDTVVREWGLLVKSGDNLSGDTLNRKPGTNAPKTSVSVCLLRFANEPATTETGTPITDGHAGTGDPISIEIFDSLTGLVVNVNAAVTLALTGPNPAGGALSGGSGNATAGVASFPTLSIDTGGPYTLRASSPVAPNNPTKDVMISDTVEECESADCSFTETQPLTSYTTTPNQGTAGADWATSLNLSGLKISCDFAPFNYPDEERQPNGVWYVYDDGQAGSVKTNVIFIDKEFVQITADNGTSKYRICYTSPVQFKDRTGNLAQPDPWTTPDENGDVGPSTYFGETWFTGLLPDCAKKNPVAPCVVNWTGTGGNRIGTFLTPPGDPGYR